ncbi:serine/threonine-protein kinase [Myxococcus sp. RHSTA-1-4]|uniref:serine/threonine protein kinase n=1 Tax=Myxococcus sp. RHSTA-1-4 TaxID=2874601 RepID=UPI001CBC57AE|nr:serine/threonine-protein kinase [Myxococcus sp. RHSTA-1-4]MBZ4418356.1 serine/threonine protein kinase [Myxococcus sp. RHSTA-1-4]
MGQGARKVGVGVWHLLAVPDGTDIGGFTVEGLLGTGASGAVYRARRGGAHFALKLQPLKGLAGWAEREVSILLRLKHPNVVGFRACGTWPDLAPRGFYLAMELVEGRPLHLWMHEEPLDARRALLLLRGLARGLEVVHAAGVLHRDIKESNIVIRASDSEPVLVDFGVGDYPGAPRLTQGVLPPGTPLYRSPEALAFRETHWRQPEARYTSAPTDDLFALGVVLYRVLTRQYPFPDVDFAGAAALEAPPIPPHEANSRVPQVLSTLCLRLLSREPGERGSAQALREEVEALLAGVDTHWEVPLHDRAPEGPVAGLRSTPRVMKAGSPGPRDHRTRTVDGLVEPEAGPSGPRMEAFAQPAPLRPSETPRAGVARKPTGRSKRTRVWLRTGVLAGLGVYLTAVLAQAPSEEPRKQEEPPDTSAVVNREVARAARGLEPAEAAPPPLAVSTSAAAAPAASQQEPDMPMKPSPSTDTPTPPGGWGPLGRTLAAAAACTGLACSSGPQMRPPPRSEPCPPGAVEAMQELGIDVESGQDGSATFATSKQPNHVLTVRDGPVRIRVGIGLGRLNNGTVSGRLFVSDRVYGYFDQGSTRDGQTYPVCFILRTAPVRDRGVPREPGDDSPDSARIYSEVELEAVPRFE